MYSNLRELLNKYLWWSRSRAKVTAPAKYPGSSSETLPETSHSTQRQATFKRKQWSRLTVSIVTGLMVQKMCNQLRLRIN